MVDTSQTKPARRPKPGGGPVAHAINGGLRHIPAWPLYILGAVPPVWYFYLGVTGGLGVEPISRLEHLMGELALQVLVIVLAVTPLRVLTGISLIKFRRALGLLGFFYVLAHLLVWLFLDVQIISQIWADIVKRPYITVGMAAFVLLLPLAFTSNNWSIRKLGPVRWRRLHMLGYAATLLGGIHFVMLSRGWQIEPMVYVFVIALLLLLRLKPVQHALGR